MLRILERLLKKPPGSVRIPGMVQKPTSARLRHQLSCEGTLGLVRSCHFHSTTPGTETHLHLKNHVRRVQIWAIYSTGALDNDGCPDHHVVLQQGVA